MEGVRGTIKIKVFRKVLAGQIVINTAEEFAKVADEICEIESLYLPIDDIMNREVAAIQKWTHVEVRL